MSQTPTAIQPGITIDSPTSRDLDDGFAVERDGEGGYVVTVAIALVADSVPVGGRLFEQAAARAETVYYKTGSDTMLPEKLTYETLSLLPDDAPKQAVLTTMHIDQNGIIQDGSIALGRFQNIWKLSYGVAATLVKNPGRIDPLQAGISYDEYNDSVRWVQLGYEVAERLYAARRQQGALAFYDAQTGVYTSLEGQIITHGRSHAAHFLIAELMIATNTFTTQYAASNDLLFLYRNHKVTQSAPEERQTIQSQYEAAVNVPRLLNLLANNLHLWFHKARYEATLFGHYALNMPYATTTSPIRRFPDLVCQHLLVAHLQNAPAPFTRSDIDAWAQAYHETIDERNKARSRTEKKKVYAEYEAMGALSDETILQLPDDRLERLLRIWWQGDQIARVPAIIDRTLHEGRALTLKAMFTLLFESPSSQAEGDVVTETREKIVAYVDAYRPFAAQLLNIAEQSGIFGTVAREDAGQGVHFMARYVVTVAGDKENVPFSTAVYEKGKSKAEARHAAAYSLLAAHVRGQLVPAVQTKKPTLPKPPPPSATLTQFDGKSPVSVLLEYCQRVQWARPAVVFEEGAPGEPHQCAVTVSDSDQNGNTYTGTGAAMSKADAKSAACAMILTQLPQAARSGGRKKAAAPLTRGHENPISVLSMWSQKRKWRKPKFFFETIWADDDRSEIKGYRCEVLYLDNRYAAEGETRKEAKRAAAEIAVTTILESRNEPTETP